MYRFHSKRESCSTINATGAFAAVCAYLACVIASYYTVKIFAVIIKVMSEDSVHFDLCNLRPEFSDTLAMVLCLNRDFLKLNPSYGRNLWIVHTNEFHRVMCIEA